MTTTIVVGVTERPESRAALWYAVDEAKARAGKLHVVRIWVESFGDNPAKAREWNSRLEQLRKEGEEQVQQLSEEGIIVTHRVEPVDNDPAGTLLEVVDEVNADLLVIGIRRRSPVGKLVLGSVSQDILLRAQCPVLAVKAPEDAYS
jgi:nucleotide-binding universal stress UspA family protein